MRYDRENQVENGWCMDDLVTVIEQAQGEDEATRHAAFNRLVMTYRGMAYRQALRILQDSNMAEDAVQEAFIVAYTRIDQLREPQAFTSWMRRIVMTQCDRLIRGKKPTLEPIETRFDLATPQPSPEAMVEARDVQTLIQTAIDSLPEHERAVTQGFYMQGESQKELAERLGVPVTTVKKRLQYAREHLRVLVGDIHAVVDDAIARVLHPPKPQRQPIYIYSRRQPTDDDHA